MLRAGPVLAALFVLSLSFAARAARGPEACGNGAIDSAEACDDGNVSDGDGCDGDCAIEEGFACDNAGTTNLLVNGDFELGNEGWSSDATVLTDGAAAMDGEVSVRESPNAYVTSSCVSGKCLDGNAGGLVWKQTITVEPSTTYYFTAFVAVRTDGNNGDASSRLVLRKDGANIAATFTGHGPPPAPWTTYGSQFATGAEQTSVQVEIYNEYLASPGNGFVLDEIAVVKKPSVCAVPSNEPDAGEATPDAGPVETVDAGDEPTPEPTGCGCGAGNVGAFVLLPLAGLLRRWVRRA